MTGSIITVLEKTLNYVDHRLVGHGKRVAYLTYTGLRRQGMHDDDALRRLSWLALLHDVGAYKTEEIDNMVRFETDSIWEHSVYGYLFIKYFSPLKELAPALLFHHAGCSELAYLHPSYHEAAQIIHVADRFDILMQTKNLTPEAFRRHFDADRGKRFVPSVLELFFHDGWESLLSEMDEDREFHRIVYGGTIPYEQTIAFISMLALIIDFRSAQTVTHTLTSTSACVAIAGYLDMDPQERASVFTSAMLHDLGKISTPLSILEKPGRLDAAERAVMQKHVTVTRELLAGTFDECALRMAVRHHERLDGSGYPEGLTAKDLTTGQRLIAVGDIYSALCTIRTYKDAYPKVKVAGIMETMAVDGLIDPFITAVVLQHYDAISHVVEEALRPVLNVYEQIHAEYVALMEWTRDLGKASGEGGLPLPVPGIQELAEQDRR